MEKIISRKILVIGLLFLFLGASVTLGVGMTQDSKSVTTYRTDWSENFDTYANGSPLHGQGGWAAWDNVAANTGYVSNVQSRSSPNSLEVHYAASAADMVHEYSGVNTGTWVFSAWQYVPSGTAGAQYFILMNTYVAGTTHNSPDWSLQIEFSATGNYIRDFNDVTKTLPLIKDAWTEISVEIDFDADVQTVYYDGTFLLSKSWKNGVAQGGAQNLAIVDLWAGESVCNSVYWDDLSLTYQVPLSCSANGPYSGNVGEDIQFTGTAVGGTEPYTWSWDFGDFNSSTDQNPSHAYTQPGNYDVVLTVTDGVSTTVTDQTTATITEILEPEIQITNIAGGLFTIKATIKNTGNLVATNVNWNITLTGGAFIGKESSGTIASISPGTQQVVKSSFILGFGKTVVTVTASVPGSSDTMEQNGTILLFYIKL